MKGKNADLPVRLASALVMAVIAGTALWLGGWWFSAFIIIIASICLFEFSKLIQKAARPVAARIAFLAMGAAYIGLAAFSLVQMPSGVVLGVVAVVTATDVGAYFSGRAIGGPKIAPKISPSKTWAGLGGGALAAGLVSAGAFLFNTQDFKFSVMLMIAFAIGACLAAVAQAGDFFESWLKRKAGVKDASNLIPGHGGVFDRIDGLLPVAIIANLLWALHPA